MSVERWHLLSIGLANLGLILGIVAAYYWWKASQVTAIPAWGTSAPADPHLELAGWVAALNDAAALSGALNSKAALYSGAAVVVSTGAGWLGALT